MEIPSFSVTELNSHIKLLLDSDPLLGAVAVRGELSNYKIYPSGHHYFTLKDQESSLRCVMFKSSASKLRFRPENGMSVTAVGGVSVYPRDGAYQLYCRDILPEGMGDLHIAFEQLKAKLEKEGLFDPSHKKPIPRFPKRIAVITSSAGAAVRDVIRVLGKRWPLAEVVVLPVRVQGEMAPPEIIGAIRYANRYKVADLIITGRGGGSIEDLWAFNDEGVARAVYASEIPVISAVGHEPDVTICDYVADLRAATPSNGAELAAPDREELKEYLSGARARLTQSMEKRLSGMKQHLDFIAGRRVLTEPESYVEKKRQELDSLYEQLCSRFEGRLGREKNRFSGLASALDALSPLKVLGRGYAIASDDSGKALTDAGEVSAGERITVSLSRGGLECLVEKIIDDKQGGLPHGGEEKEL